MSSDWFPFQLDTAWRPDTLWICSPDRTKAVRAGNFGEPDGDLLLFNRKGLHLLERLESCGTPCQFLGASWCSNQCFVFVHTYEHFEGRGERPNVSSLSAIVSLYDLEFDSIHSFASDPILRRPSFYIDSMISLIWDNPVAVHFIHTTFEEANIPGFRDNSLSYFDLNDSTAIDLGPSERVEPMVLDSVSFTELWIHSPDSSGIAGIVLHAGDSTELRVYQTHGESTTVRSRSYDAARHQLALRWLSSEILLVLRVDEDSHFSQRLGHQVIDGHVATVVLYNLERGYQLGFGYYILMPD